MDKLRIRDEQRFWQKNREWGNTHWNRQTKMKEKKRHDHWWLSSFLMHQCCAGEIVLVSGFIKLQNKVTLDKPELEKNKKRKKQQSEKNISKVKQAWALKGGIMNWSPNFRVLCPASTALFGQRVKSCSEGRRVPEEEQILCTRRNSKDWRALKYAQNQVVKKEQ